LIGDSDRPRKFNSENENPKLSMFDPYFLEVDFETEKLQIGVNASI